MSDVRRQAVLLPRPNWGWQDRAACKGADVVLFFGPDGDGSPSAISGSARPRRCADRVPSRWNA